jgi:putative DNA primase/helicase
VLTEEQKETLKAEAAQRSAQRQLDLAREQEKASRRAFAKFVNAKEATPEQAYLKAKGIAPCGAREDENGNLLIAGQDITGHIHTLQTITMQNVTSAGKRFEPGSRKTGCFHAIDPDNKLGTEPILITEGFATAASVHMATGLPVVAAFDAGNLEPVATALREKFPEAPMLILADDDHSLDPNVGLEKARQAAKAVGAKVLAPPFTAEEKAKGLTDFNDLHQSRGDKGLALIKERVEREVKRVEQVRGEVGR